MQYQTMIANDLYEFYLNESNNKYICEGEQGDRC